MLNWVAMPSSRGSSQPRAQIHVPCLLWVIHCCCYVASVVSNSVRPHRWQPTRLPCPWDSPGKNTGVGCHFLLQCMQVKSESEVAQSCPTPSDPRVCSLPGSSIHGIFQARVLEWVAIAFSIMHCRQFLYHWATGEAVYKCILPYTFLRFSFNTPGKKGKLKMKP